MKKITIALLLFFFLGCKEENKIIGKPVQTTSSTLIEYAKGFSIEKLASGITILHIHSAWPGAESSFSYALIPKKILAKISLNKDDYDGVITTPVERIVVTSTTHIPALEALEVEERLIGFPDSQYISSEKTRKRIDKGLIKDLGSNELINTEMLLELNPDVVIGFGISGKNKAYNTLEDSNIAVVYNGDWAEESPLGKAEWIKFFAPFFEKEKEADSIFNGIARSYNDAKALAQTATSKPTLLSGALYKDVWYLPGGKSWAAQFFNDANTNYLWAQNTDIGSLSLSWESVLSVAKKADYWIGPAQFTSYSAMNESSIHYQQFKAYKNKQIFTFAKSKGATGGLLYYELAPHRPDLVLKDLIHIFHPQLMNNHEPIFFKPLD